MGPGTLCEDLNSQGFPITREAAKKLFYTYEKEFKTGVNYLRNAGDLASKQGYLINSNGRRRYWNLPDASDSVRFPGGNRDWKYKSAIGAITREGGNFLIQSVNADITKLGMIKIRDYKKKHGVRTYFANQVYDEIVTITHKDDSPDWIPVKRRLMVEAGEEFVKSVAIEVEGEVQKCWTK